MWGLQSFPHSGFFLGTWSICLAPSHHLLSAGRTGCKRCWPNPGKYTPNKGSLIFLMSNFWHLYYRLAQKILRDDQHRTWTHKHKHQDTYSTQPSSSKYGPPCLNRSKMIAMATWGEYWEDEVWTSIPSSPFATCLPTLYRARLDCQCACGAANLFAKN